MASDFNSPACSDRFPRERDSDNKRVRERAKRGCPVLRDSSPFSAPSERITPREKENAIIKTSNEFYVCECGVSATFPPNPIFGLLQGSSVAWYRFSSLDDWLFPDISAMDRLHPQGRPIAKLANRKKNLTLNFLPPNICITKYKKCIVVCIGCCCRKIIR